MPIDPVGGVTTDTGRAHNGIHVPGIYAVTLRGLCEEECAPDIYRALDDDWRAYKRDCEAGMLKAAVLFRERLSACEPLVVMDHQLGDHDMRLPRGAFPGVHGFRVTADDVVSSRDCRG
jgi:hypothetical protein